MQLAARLATVVARLATLVARPATALVSLSAIAWPVGQWSLVVSFDYHSGSTPTVKAASGSSETLVPVVSLCATAMAGGPVVSFGYHSGRCTTVSLCATAMGWRDPSNGLEPMG